MNSGEIDDGNAPVRRTARARKVNSRFAGADIDESYRKLVGRITAPDFSSDKNEKGDCEGVGGDILEVVGRSEVLLKLKEGDNESALGGPQNFTLKTIAVKRVKKRKLTCDERPPTPYAEAVGRPSVIVKYRSSTESDTSEASFENEVEKRRKLESIEEEPPDVGNASPQTNKIVLSDTFPIVSLNRSHYLNLEQNPAKIVLADQNQMNFPGGKKLKIVSLKIPTENEKLNLQNLNNVEFKLVKKEKNKVKPSSKMESSLKSQKPKMAEADVAPDGQSINWFSSDGEDDLPLNMFMTKEAAKRKTQPRKKPASQKKKIKKLGLSAMNSKTGNLIRKRPNLGLKAPPKMKVSKMIRKDYTDIVINVGGKEGDYACVVVDKSKLISRTDGESRIKPTSETMKKYTYIKECVVPGFNQGLVLEADIPEPKSKSSKKPGKGEGTFLKSKLKKSKKMEKKLKKRKKRDGFEKHLKSLESGDKKSRERLEESPFPESKTREIVVIETERHERPFEIESERLKSEGVVESASNATEADTPSAIPFVENEKEEEKMAKTDNLTEVESKKKMGEKNQKEKTKHHSKERERSEMKEREKNEAKEREKRERREAKEKERKKSPKHNDKHKKSRTEIPEEDGVPDSSPVRKVVKKNSFEDMLAKELDDTNKLKLKLSRKDDKKSERRKSRAEKDERRGSSNHKGSEDELLKSVKKEDIEDSPLKDTFEGVDAGGGEGHHQRHSSQRKHRKEEKSRSLSSDQENVKSHHHRSGNAETQENVKSHHHRSGNAESQNDESSHEHKRSKHHRPGMETSKERHYHHKHKKHEKDKDRHRENVDVKKKESVDEFVAAYLHNSHSSDLPEEFNSKNEQPVPACTAIKQEGFRNYGKEEKHTDTLKEEKLSGGNAIDGTLRNTLLETLPNTRKEQNVNSELPQIFKDLLKLGGSNTSWNTPSTYNDKESIFKTLSFLNGDENLNQSDLSQVKTANDQSSAESTNIEVLSLATSSGASFALPSECEEEEKGNNDKQREEKENKDELLAEKESIAKRQNPTTMSIPLSLIPLPGEVIEHSANLASDGSEDKMEYSDESDDVVAIDDKYNLPVTPKPDKLSPIELTPEEMAEIERRNVSIVEERMRSFENLDENIYLVDRVKSKSAKEVRRLVCDCTLTKEELANNEMGCGEDCINKLLMIECGLRCPLQDHCMNKNFQKKNYSNVEVFNADQKGCGVRTCADILPGTFIMEYVGEVFDLREFRRRKKEYAKSSSSHFYFMALRSDRFIDATRKGNISRFINHSCNPNAETQKWTVNGQIRIGFFATNQISDGEEINFDYRLERYGREPQKCYCGASECRGWLGESPDEKTKEEKEEDKRREVREKKKKKEERNLEDLDLEEEIEELNLRGLRNRQDTLNLSRLMVRALGYESRMRLLKLLESAETACKRLFLDYHGLKLLWSWMADISSLQKCIPLKVEILKTLTALPITNKTQLVDSRVLNIVERWSKEDIERKEKELSSLLKEKKPTPPLLKEEESCHVEKENDESALKPRDTSDESDSESPTDSKERSQPVSPDDTSSLDSSETRGSSRNNHDSQPEAKGAEEESSSSSSSPPDTETLSVCEMAKALLPIWSSLKEAFRIPKKQRVRMMKEHEREADQEYKEYLDRRMKAGEERNQSLYDYDKWRHGSERERSPSEKREQRKARKRKRRSARQDEEDDWGLSKEERRERFAQQVAKEDEKARQKKQQDDMWTLHLQRCALLGHDPNYTPIFDPSGRYYWDPTAESWEAYVGPNGDLPVPASCYSSNHMVVPNSLSTPEEALFPSGNVDPSSIPLPGELPSEAGSLTLPLPPPNLLTLVLPPKWKIARDDARNIYFYHTKTRFAQWQLPTNNLHDILMTKYDLNSESETDSDSDTTSSDSEDFSSDEDEEVEEEQDTLIQKSDAGDEKMVRRIRGKKKRSEKLVQERVISPILFEDREAARRERKEAKERAREEARNERWTNYKNKLANRTTEGAKVEDAVDSSDENEDDEVVEPGAARPPPTTPTKGSSKRKVPNGKSSKEKSKERAATAMADNSGVARKRKDSFRSKMATFIVSVLNPYRKADCSEGRITNNEDFKYLARKLTHFVMVKELKQLPSVDGLDCSESVKHKTKEFVRKYMSKYGSCFKRDPSDTKEY